MNFLGNLRTKLFFQNNEPETGDYMRRLGGKVQVTRHSKSRGPDGKTSTGETPVEEDVLPAHAAHNLRTGGKADRFKVTGFLIVGSKRQSDGDPYQKILIHQKRLGRSWWPFSKRVQIVARMRPCPDFRYLRRAV
jgi:hypothetical protein